MTTVTPPTYPEIVVAATGSKGHPLYWGEVKDVAFYMALFKDLNVTHVFDITPGSGAAACAAAMLGISYEGVAMSSLHASWLENIMDKAIFAIIADVAAGDGEEDQALQKEVKAHCSNLVDQGRTYLSRTALGEPETEDEDESDIDDPEEPES